MTWREAVLAYQRCPLQINGHYALFPDETGTIPAESCWPQQYPNSDRKGVYLILSKTDVPLYIGKAAKQGIGKRLGVYFGTDRKTKGCRVKHPVAPADWKGSEHFSGWCQRPAYIVTVAVADDKGNEASNLETYLIEQLQPCCNTVGIRKEINQEHERK
jgi:hypothetical protein